MTADLAATATPLPGAVAELLMLLKYRVSRVLLRLKSRRYAEYRPVHRHVVFVLREPATLCIVDVQSFVADHAAPRDIRGPQEVEIQSTDRLPRELTSCTKTSDIAAYDQPPAWSELMP